MQTVVYWAKEFPVRFGLWVAAMDGATAGLAYWLSSEVKTDRGLIVAGAVFAGIGLALGTLFLAALLTAPRRNLQIQLAELQETVTQQGTAIEALAHERWGEPGDFLPVYHGSWETRGSWQPRYMVRSARRLATWTDCERLRDFVSLIGRVKPSDDLESALLAFYEAEAALTAVIGDGYEQESIPELDSLTEG